MILNPPNIVEILRSWSCLARIDAAFENGPCKFLPYQLAFLRGMHTRILSKRFRQHLGPMEWDAFKRIYQLYLQSIPFATAREAWGLMNAGNPDTNKP